MEGGQEEERDDRKREKGHVREDERRWRARRKEGRRGLCKLH